MSATQQFYAHSTERPDKSDWQTLQSHLENVAARAQKYGTFFGAGGIARTAGLLHDLGKYTVEFQKRLSGEHGRVDHSTWGARVACERYGHLGQLLAYSIAGHHAGLANGAEGEGRRALGERLKATPEQRLHKQWEKEVLLPVQQELTPPPAFRTDKKRAGFQLSLLGRMIFSCLVDADFLDTEEFYCSAEERGSQRVSVWPKLEVLREELERKLNRFSADSDVNRWRAEILAHVRQQAAQAPGKFSLTVPTGGGKTLASLAFALDHAITHGLRRVIYVIPFNSIVEQTADVFREALGPWGESAVLEHHSAFNDDQGKGKDEREKLYLAAENWDAPVVVTTAVQFFESLFADRPSRCRKLHNIAASVVVFDEAQTLPLKLLRPCVAAIDELSLNYRTSVVLCTATQPALKADDGFRDGFEGVRELAPEPQRLYEQFRRVTVRHAGTLNDEELAAQLRGSDQVLCIVNNRRHARALYEAIREQPGACHLTTLMCAQHRGKVLRRVRRRLKDGEPCRLVATSLIEAGVDVDFPRVLRAEAGLDSIAQAAGRCNREGRQRSDQSEVIVFATENEDWAPPAELKQFAQVFREVRRLHIGDPLALAAIHKYFRQLYWQKEADLDKEDILGRLRGSRVDSLPFETVAQLFRMIENLQYPVIVAYDKKARATLRRLDYAEKAGGIARELQRYTVPVPRQGFEALKGAGVVQAKRPERYGEQFMELLNPDLYDEQCGLSWENPSFMRAESLIF